MLRNLSKATILAAGLSSVTIAPGNRGGLVSVGLHTVTKAVFCRVGPVRLFIFSSVPLTAASAREVGTQRTLASAGMARSAILVVKSIRKKRTFLHTTYLHGQRRTV